MGMSIIFAISKFLKNVLPQFDIYLVYIPWYMKTIVCSDILYILLNQSYVLTNLLQFGCISP